MLISEIQDKFPLLYDVIKDKRTTSDDNLTCSFNFDRYPEFNSSTTKSFWYALHTLGNNSESELRAIKNDYPLATHLFETKISYTYGDWIVTRADQVAKIVSIIEPTKFRVRYDDMNFNIGIADIKRKATIDDLLDETNRRYKDEELYMIHNDDIYCLNDHTSFYISNLHICKKDKKGKSHIVFSEDINDFMYSWKSLSNAKDRAYLLEYYNILYPYGLYKSNVSGAIKLLDEPFVWESDAFISLPDWPIIFDTTDGHRNAIIRLNEDSREFSEAYKGLPSLAKIKYNQSVGSPIIKETKSESNIETNVNKKESLSQTPLHSKIANEVHIPIIKKSKKLNSLLNNFK